MRLLILAKESKAQTELRLSLSARGFDCMVAAFQEKVPELLSHYVPDLILVEAGTMGSAAWGLITKIKHESFLPVIALAAGDLPDDAPGYLEVDDFLTSPYDVKELTVRIQRLLKKNQKPKSDVIKSENLVIDLTNCEVTVRGKLVELTFKEYELLKLLAANKGRVYTREDLLNKIWGYEYFGGDRTVDVHVRRLRSKIEGPTDTFIETVRNIGYRFKREG